MYKIKADDLIKSSSQPKALRIIIDQMKVFQERRAYSEYMPDFDFSNPQVRAIAGSALYDLWQFCVENELPLLNMLVVGKKSNIPGHGVEAWYEEQYGTLAGYDKFCDLHAQLAEAAFKNKLIEIL